MTFVGVVRGETPEPPPVTLRDIANAPRIARGTSITLEQTTVTIALTGQPPRNALAQVVLFLPEGWNGFARSGGVPLTIHFHGAPWYAVEEHARRGARNPLLAFYLGEGSSMYEKPMQRSGYFEGLLARASAAASAELRSSTPVRLIPEEIQSFSAGYGAVRQLLRTPIKTEIKRILLADSLYASLTTASVSQLNEPPCGAEITSDGLARYPDPEQMRPFLEFALRARAGEAQFLFAHSTIRVSSYAYTVRTADALVCGLGVRREPVPSGSIAAASPDQRFPLESRCDAGKAHIWAYRGTDPQAHMAVARCIAELWQTLDAEW